MDDEYRPTNFVLPSADFVEVDDDGAPPQLGDGVFLAGLAYRVVDVWLIAYGATAETTSGSAFRCVALSSVDDCR
jgi:hypothetical protein